MRNLPQAIHTSPLIHFLYAIKHVLLCQEINLLHYMNDDSTTRPFPHPLILSALKIIYKTSTFLIWWIYICERWTKGSFCTLSETRCTLYAYLEYKLSHIGYSFICRARSAFEAMQVVTCQYEVPDEFIDNSNSTLKW